MSTMSYLAIVFVAYDPREYLEYDGILVPQNGPTLVALLITHLLMLGFLIGVVAHFQQRRAGDGDDGRKTTWPTESLPPWPGDRSSPRERGGLSRIRPHSRARRISRLFDEPSPAACAMWN